MKYYILVALIGFSLCCGAQNRLFKHYSDQEDVTSVIISKKMFTLIGGMSGLDVDGMPSSMKGLTSKISGLQILSTENPVMAKEMKEAFKGLVGKTHEELMRVKDHNDKLIFYIKEKGDKIQELLMLNTEASEFTVIRLEGLFTIEDIKAITQD